MNPATGAPATRTTTIAPILVGWYPTAARPLPWREPGVTPWGILVSEFMAQQTPVARVTPHWREWMSRWPTPACLAAESPATAVRAWDRLGYPRRALWLHRTATIITTECNGDVPREIATLLTLPGVGPYTARAVAAFAFGDRHPVVDTNTRRVIARAVHGQAEAGSPRTAADLADMLALLPITASDAQTFNAAIMELGATVCTAASPACGACPIAAHCAWQQAGCPAHRGPRAARQARYEGSDREVRGLIMSALRHTHRPVPRIELAALWQDAAQFTRALVSLVSDGLAVEHRDGFTLPET
ncbi:MAG: adenine glycosylase [Candidatus Lumbricidophila eiseniae]|uniref:Adenine DNA glycosylase n=1 Tax=Candidatus Lumbricidiphila eiseniae TaxID=1969409 RepID=A0A2A6FQT8_9MICO|nr:MAG: adenine glycosylase [Candidatus Lumbricidophila eiseniae]